LDETLGTLCKTRENSAEIENVLPCNPTPELKRILRDPPPSTELLKLAQMPLEERERAARLVGVQIELADLDGYAVGEDFGFGPAFGPGWEGRRGVEHEGKLSPGLFVVFTSLSEEGI
jgi:hypothetical protein